VAGPTSDESSRFTQRGVDPSGASVLMTSYSATGNEGPSLIGDNKAAYAGNSVVFGAILARMSLFSEATFAFRDLADKHLSGAFEIDGRRNTALRKLEAPWPNGTTGELLARMIQDADLAGNAYVWDAGDQLVRLRPDWVTIVSELSSDPMGRPYRSVLGYYYEPPVTSRRFEGEPQYFTVDEVAHWSPNPDPEANFRGMSWLTPVIREVWADNQMTNYKIKYLENAASPNLLIRYTQRLGQDSLSSLAARVEARHGGVDNAFKTLVLDDGADVTVIGNTFEQMNFSTVQAAGENRIIIASGVPGIVIGSKEGLMAATYSNYEQAMRRFADITMRPLWRSVCACLSKLVTIPPGTRLWFDTADIAALRQGEKERADTMLVLSQAAAELIAAGAKPDTVTAAVAAGDITLLKFEPKPPPPPAAPPSPVNGQLQMLNGNNQPPALNGAKVAVTAGKVSN
jgi:phage portal protein BeeE